MEVAARARGTRAGEGTLRRAILLQSLVSEQASGAGTGLLEQVQLWNREYVTRGGLDDWFGQAPALIGLHTNV